MGNNKKEIRCVIWDLDGTLWEGILLEGNDVRLKPGVEKVIKTLDSRGILHSIASRNEYELAMEKLKDFGLDEYFLYPEINWNSKSMMVRNIQYNLNISMDTILFIDDQSFEREEVKIVHPDITCIDSSYYLCLPDMKRLNPRFITDESKQRRQKYFDHIKRIIDEENFEGVPEEFLFSLKMKFIIREAKEEDLKRAVDLTSSIAQLNSIGRTFNYDELNSFIFSDKHKLLICELTDKYGSYGKIGLALIEINDDSWCLRLLLMACHVLSRGVGTVLLSHIMREAKKARRKLMVDFKNTGKNRMMYTSLLFANFKEVSSDDRGNILFKNDLSMIQPVPPYIELIVY